MNVVAGRAVDTYTRLEVETGVAAASPQKLVVMLYEGAIKAVLSAQARWRAVISPSAAWQSRRPFR